MPDASDPPRGTWAALFHQTTDAVFLLNPRRRLRYVNPAFEALTKAKADQVVHEYCHPRKVQKDLPAGRRMLLQTLAPPKSTMAGEVTTVRRPVPPAKLGPPWWDIAFVPLREGEKIVGVLGHITPVGQPMSHAGGKGLSEALAALRQQAAARNPLSNFAFDPRLQAQAELAARTFAPVWLVGGPGTGKESLARAIHHHGVTKEKSFLAVDCRGLQPYLVRGLLFGHNGMAETGRLGTIYLKSPEAMPPDLQAELIEWSELLADECRIVVGVGDEKGLTPEFRAALGIIEIRLPTLASQPERIRDLLAGQFEHPECVSLFLAHPWPGNLREFGSVLASALRKAAGARVEPSHLPHAFRRAAGDAKATATLVKPGPAPTLDAVLESVERRMIALALRKSKGDQTAAAALLDIHRSRLLRRMQALGLGE